MCVFLPTNYLPLYTLYILSSTICSAHNLRLSSLPRLVQGQILDTCSSAQTFMWHQIIKFNLMPHNTMHINCTLEPKHCVMLTPKSASLLPTPTTCILSPSFPYSLTSTHTSHYTLPPSVMEHSLNTLYYTMLTMNPTIWLVSVRSFILLIRPLTVEVCHRIGQIYLLDLWQWNSVTWLVRFTY